ncbi:carotenoid oxygenase family protein [Streptomyces ipomoeae]|uniref:Dioxygenase n=2 Tax=Streptomyces ipomoeae TaxID=103232 RepID=L1L7K4_9ACTN|nr:carotenoid oxygenase family protein [Streptomyces ipomoeae]EKX69026.1 hypothetical protein STRIP9103_09100 [Streptomyces ipomoeae 91-03]MDX2827679.1 carotenoid oxygenase family protein [Streptomyces ipomoeae]MDX2842760.1 carotenoid oxygenase family protein [Streptomyces ipomoeae]MDX2876347.1 carotenoid oxygenase family protein [Streptomyces ipomoeae]
MASTFWAISASASGWTREARAATLTAATTCLSTSVRVAEVNRRGSAASSSLRASSSGLRAGRTRAETPALIDGPPPPLRLLRHHARPGRRHHVRRTARHDCLLGSTIVVEGPDGLTNPAEPVFVPRESAHAEDDGYPLSLWWNRTTDLTELLIHDAADLRRTPPARVKLPSRVPFGFHGSRTDHHTLDRAVAARHGDGR